MRQLLNARVAVDPRDSASATPLALAAAAGSVPCLRALLAYGASAGATDSTGQTARQLAAAAGHHAADLYLLAVESTAAAFPGRPSRVDLLAGEDGELDAIFRQACGARDEVSLFWRRLPLQRACRLRVHAAVCAGQAVGQLAACAGGGCPPLAAVGPVLPSALPAGLPWGCAGGSGAAGA